MLDHIFLFSGASAVGKTSVLRSLIPLLQHKGAGPCALQNRLPAKRRRICIC